MEEPDNISSGPPISLPLPPSCFAFYLNHMPKVYSFELVFLFGSTCPPPECVTSLTQPLDITCQHGPKACHCPLPHPTPLPSGPEVPSVPTLWGQHLARSSLGGASLKFDTFGTEAEKKMEEEGEILCRPGVGLKPQHLKLPTRKMSSTQFCIYIWVHSTNDPALSPVPALAALQ